MAESNFDQPQDEPLFIATSSESPEFQTALWDAFASLGHFRALVEKFSSSEAAPLVKLHFPEDDLWLWLMVLATDDDGFFVESFEAPPELPHLKPGSRFFVSDEQVADWMLNDNGQLHGGYTLRLQRNLLPAEERPSFDTYVGVSEYLPLPG